MITVVVRTRNEEANIEICLSALCTAFKHVIVVDQSSTDQTVALCKRYPVMLVPCPDFTSESKQLQWILGNAGIETEWFYLCDADEVVSSELAAELTEAASTAESSVGAFALRYKNYFCGRWIKHCGIYPVWVTRLFRVNAVNWTREINTTAHVQGDVGYLDGHFDHHSFRKGLEHWISKHNLYSSAEAREEVAALSTKDSTESLLTRLLRRHHRRQALKQIASHLPTRPLLRFFYMYVLRAGFLDGLPGLHYCTLMAIYEYFISIKRSELLHPPFGK